MGILSEGREPVQYATPAAAMEGSTDFCLRSGTRAGLPAAGAGGAHWPAVRCGPARSDPRAAPVDEGDDDVLLVHVAGTADLGIPLIVGGRSRPRQETAELTARRAAELDAARTGGRAADLLFGLRFTQKDPRDFQFDCVLSPGPRRQRPAIFFPMP